MIRDIRILLVTPADLVLLNDDLGGDPRSFPCPVLVLTGGMSGERMQRLLAAGCAGIFMKHSLPGQLMEAIRKAVRGETWLDMRAVRTLAQGKRNQRELSDREQTVLTEVVEGQSSKQIALRLQTSETCVKAALQRIFHKTGVRTRSQLVRLALDTRSRVAA
jgi:DNA-binding NarL/FixJ family response regulator